MKNEALAVQCCVCRKMRIGGKWEKIEPFEGEPVSHTYCPGCHAEFLKEIERSNRHAEND